MGQFHYREGGETLVEELSAQQCAIDASVLGAFGLLETACAKGIDVAKSPIYDAARKVVGEALSALPPKRSAHWVAELARIGLAVDSPQPKREEQKGEKEDNKSSKAKA